FFQAQDAIPDTKYRLVGSDMCIRDWVRPEPSRFLLVLPQDDVIWEQERKAITAEEGMHKGQAKVANIRAMVGKAKEKG
ncbi:hypothetical protein, partial [Enterobacter intestinihominis]